MVEFRERRLGPYRPSGGPIPRHRYRKPRTSATRKRADRIGALARKLSVASAALSGVDGSLARAAVVPLRRPLTCLGEDDLAFINALVERILDKAAIEKAVLERFLPQRSPASKESTQC